MGGGTFFYGNFESGGKSVCISPAFAEKRGHRAGVLFEKANFAESFKRKKLFRPNSERLLSTVAGAILFLAAMAFPGILFSQVQDSVIIGKKSAKKSIIVSDLQDLTKDGFNFWQDKFAGHFTGVDFGFNSFLNDDYSQYSSEESGFMGNDRLRSNSVHLNLLKQSFGLQFNRNTTGLVTGIGLQFQNFRFEQKTTIVKLPGGRVAPEAPHHDEILKSKLSTTWLVAPLLFEFQIPIKHYANRLYFSSGVYGGLRLGSHTKIKYRVSGKNEILKITDDFSINNFKAGVMIRTGYRWANIFATYDLTPFFKDNQGPGLTPFTFGVTLVKF